MQYFWWSSEWKPGEVRYIAFNNLEVDVSYIVQLDAEARDVDKQPPLALQERFPSVQVSDLDPAKENPDLRLVYMLLDAGIPGLSRNCDLRTFGRALFYVGKGKLERPFRHLEEARNYLLKPGTIGVGARFQYGTENGTARRTKRAYEI